MHQFEVRELNASDHQWVGRLLVQLWHSTKIVSRGRIHHADQLPGFIAFREHNRLGLVTYDLANNECEIVTLNSLAERIGIGSALVAAVRNVALIYQCKRLWLVTTNDNMAALHFYQKRGFSLVAVHRHSLEQSRGLKPEIPFVGIDGIPLRDEIELELSL
jgi:GNAT superfamily N-acetyltransferase